MPRTLVVYNPIRFANEAWLPVFWAQAKTYYERHGRHKDQWRWAPCYADIWGDDFDRVKLILGHQEPDVFAVSLYVWNYQIGHRVAKWVKETWPNCLVITGGPHQYFKHDQDWFRKHPYIDASLPGECYGELCLQEVLDNCTPDGNMDWSTVSDICYPQGRSRMVATSKKTIRDQGKKTFDYQWAACHEQLSGLRHFIDYTRGFFPRAKILSIFETTRGCPYGCSYCDWGGGINSVVIKKSMSVVQKDIDALCELDLEYLYFADANFGIFGERDVNIFRYLIKQRRANVQMFSVGYGGFAKTENKIAFVRDILQLDIKNKLSILGEIKISIQSLDADVLRRIDRKNVSLERQLSALKQITRWKKVPIYVELIHGLPGMTLDKFYRELDVLGQERLSIQWYPWILLPEAPAYDRAYRQREQIGTIIKTAGWWTHENEKNNFNEIVISTSTYSRDDYLEMLISSGTYKLLVQGGSFRDSVQYLQSQGIGIGQICRDILQHFLVPRQWYDIAKQAWYDHILVNPAQGCFLDIKGESIYLGLYVPALAFLHADQFTVDLADWFAAFYGVPETALRADQQLAIHAHNLGQQISQGWRTTNFAKSFDQGTERITTIDLTNALRKIMLMFIQFKHTGHIMRGFQSLRGLPWFKIRK